MAIATWYKQHSHADLNVCVNPQTYVLECDCLPLSNFHSQIPNIYTFETWYSLFLCHSFLCLGSPCHPNSNAKPNGFKTMPTALCMTWFRGSEYQDSLGIWSHQWQFLHTMLYQKWINRLDAQSHWPIPRDPPCKMFSQWCCCTFKSINICVLKTGFFLEISVLHPMPTIIPLIKTPTQGFSKKILGHSRVLPHTMQYGIHWYTTLKQHSYPNPQVSSTLHLYIQTAENYSSPINICNILYQLSI